MYYIDDYRKKKEEENYNYIVETIIDKIINNINNDEDYQINYMLTGYNNKINKIISKLNYRARQENLELDVNTYFVPTSSTNLVINARYRNVFLKFMLIERDLYRKIVEDNIMSFDFRENKLNSLYIFDALKTAFYRAGYDSGEVIVKGRRMKFDSCNKSLKYFPKIVSMEMLKYYREIEEYRKNNIGGRHK